MWAQTCISSQKHVATGLAAGRAAALSVLVHSPITSPLVPSAHASLVSKSVIFHLRAPHTWAHRKALRQQPFAVSMLDAHGWRTCDGKQKCKPCVPSSQRLK